MGFISTAASVLNAVAFVQQASDLATIATRWQLYAKSDGFYQQDPSGTVKRLLTTTDVPSATTGELFLSAGGGWA